MSAITTLNRIREHGPCADGWRKLLAHLGKSSADDEPLDLLTILDSNGLDDALWCLRTMPEHNRHWRLYAVWCARQVQHLMTDPRSIAALRAKELWIDGRLTDEELAAARDAARAAARDAARDAAGTAAWAAAWAAARAAAWDAARAAAWDAARAAAGDAAWDAAGDAAGAAAWAAAGDAAWDAQTSWIRENCTPAFEVLK